MDGENIAQAIAPVKETPETARDISPAIDSAERARKFASASRAASTLRAYRSDLRDFESWCTGRTINKPLPATAETVGMYLAALADRGAAVSTIERRVAAITLTHRISGHDNPCHSESVRAVLAGIRRTLGAAPVKKTALTAETLRGVLRRIPEDLAGIRDRALLLLGFAGALRRSELVALDIADVERHPKGIVLTLRRSKTDQAGLGIKKAIPHGRRLHPVAALDTWLSELARRGVSEGALFRGVKGSTVLARRLSDQQVAAIVKKRAAAAGLDPALFAGHSLRSGYITSAADSGASLTKIADQAGHAKLDTTRGYVQVADAFRDHSGKGFL